MVLSIGLRRDIILKVSMASRILSAVVVGRV